MQYSLQCQFHVDDVRKLPKFYCLFGWLKKRLRLIYCERKHRCFVETVRLISFSKQGVYNLFFLFNRVFCNLTSTLTIDQATNISKMKSRTGSLELVALIDEIYNQTRWGVQPCRGSVVVTNLYNFFVNRKKMHLISSWKVLKLHDWMHDHTYELPKCIWLAIRNKKILGPIECNNFQRIIWGFYSNKFNFS